MNTWLSFRSAQPSKVAQFSVGDNRIARMKAKGIIVNDISPAETARMREAVRPVHDTYIPAIGAEMMTAVQDDLKRVRGQ